MSVCLKIAIKPPTNRGEMWRGLNRFSPEALACFALESLFRGEVTLGAQSGYLGGSLSVSGIVSSHQNGGLLEWQRCVPSLKLATAWACGCSIHVTLADFGGCPVFKKQRAGSVGNNPPCNLQAIRRMRFGEEDEQGIGNGSDRDQFQTVN